MSTDERGYCDALAERIVLRGTRPCRAWHTEFVKRPEPQGPAARAKLEAVDRAVQYSFPTADIAEMLREIERGYADCEERDADG
jgi:hypothetical protein